MRRKVSFRNGLVTKLRLKPPSRDRQAGESSLLGGRSAAATKTASKAETCLIHNDSGFRRCLVAFMLALVASTALVRSQSTQNAQIVAVRAGRLFDPRSGTNLTNQVVLINGDR